MSLLNLANRPSPVVPKADDLKICFLSFSNLLTEMRVVAQRYTKEELEKIRDSFKKEDWFKNTQKEIEKNVEVLNELM